MLRCQKKGFKWTQIWTVILDLIPMQTNPPLLPILDYECISYINHYINLIYQHCSCSDTHLIRSLSNQHHPYTNLHHFISVFNHSAIFVYSSLESVIIWGDTADLEACVVLTKLLILLKLRHSFVSNSITSLVLIAVSSCFLIPDWV